MLTLNTFGILLEYGYTLTAYCYPCNRRVDIDLSKLPPDDRSTNRRWRCTKCGTLGSVTMSPPVHKII